MNLNVRTRSVLGLVMILMLSISLACIGSPTFSEGERTLKVVIDNNYPPYSFLDTEGKPQGISIDQWRLFEKKTGIHVEIKAMNWSKALEVMKNGQADVIDTIFYNDERAKIYDFTKGYANLDVPIFFNRNISGITGVESLRGFAVAVKEGDNAVDVLRNKGVSNLKIYKSYEEIVQAAKEQNVTIFVIDQPPALYYMYKMQIQDKFNSAGSLYSGQFHRAVKKGNVELLHTLEKGFAKITLSEYQSIESKWFGTASSTAKSVRFTLYALGGFALVVLLLVVWNASLRRRVRVSTAELRAMVGEIEDSRNRVQAILEALPDMFFLLDRQGIFVEYHGRKNDETYATAESFIGKRMWSVFPPLLAQRFQIAINALFETKIQQREEYELDYPNGKRYFESRMVLCGEEHLVGIVRDITERKMAELTIENQIEDLKDKNAEMERFTYAISHDLKSPLITIKGFTGALLADIQNHRLDRVPSDVGQIEEATKKMQDLLEGMLELSRVGRIVNPSTSFPLDQVLSDVMKKLERAIVENNCRVELQEDLPVIHADYHQIHEIFLKLIENAIKFGNHLEGTVITVGAEYGEKETVFFVSDNGPGIAQENQEKVFDTFEKLGNPSDGIGVGLTLVKRMVELHRGRIWIENRDGGGVTFKFTLSADRIE